MPAEASPTDHVKCTNSDTPWPFFADKTPLERAVFLETTELFADIHAAVAASGQSAVPDNLDTDLHFTCFVQAPEAAVREAEIATAGKRRLIELDGRRAGPVDRGESTDLLKVRTSVAAGQFVFARVICTHLRTWQSMLKSRSCRRRRAWNLV